MNHYRKEITRVLTVPLACACLVGALLWPNWREEIYAQTYYCYDSSSSAAPTASAAAVSTLDEPVDCEESPYMCVDGTSRYIARVYADLLGRWPGPTEIAAVRAAYPQGLPDIRFAQEIVESQEYRHQVVQHLTKQLLRRPATPAEQAYRATHHHRAITLGLLTSPEYATRTGGTGEDYVAGVYQALLSREAEPAELREELQRLARQGRRAVVQELYDSEEHHEEQVDRVYLALLRMPPTPAGRAEWVRAMHDGGRLEQLIAAVVTSTEYEESIASEQTLEPAKLTEQPGLDVRSAGVGTLQSDPPGSNRTCVADKKDQCTGQCATTNVPGSLLDGWCTWCEQPSKEGNKNVVKTWCECRKK
jgi:hypothetical protein